ncbi:MAG TPA: TrmH family RNA methyltransferase, partial [Anaerolineales bacterium]|nr:TrmH family RNA methyltransferase [Anaerolineales bacterium]
MAEFLYRRNVVLEALRAGRRDFKRLIIASDANRDSLRDVLAEAQRRKIKIDQRLTKELNTITHGENHQGVVLEVGPYLYAEFDEPLARAHSAGEPPLLLLLDQVQDPANVGRLLRTAEACGAHGVYMPEKGSGEITPAVVTASMGASEHMRVVRAGNMARAIEMLKQQDVWIAGLDLSPEAQQFDQVDLKRSLGIVVGNEGA